MRINKSLRKEFVRRKILHSRELTGNTTFPSVDVKDLTVDIRLKVYRLISKATYFWSPGPSG